MQESPKLPFTETLSTADQIAHMDVHARVHSLLLANPGMQFGMFASRDERGKFGISVTMYVPDSIDPSTPRDILSRSLENTPGKDRIQINVERGAERLIPRETFDEDNDHWEWRTAVEPEELLEPAPLPALTLDTTILDKIVVEALAKRDQEQLMDSPSSGWRDRIRGKLPWGRNGQDREILAEPRPRGRFALAGGGLLAAALVAGGVIVSNPRPSQAASRVWEYLGLSNFFSSKDVDFHKDASGRIVAGAGPKPSENQQVQNPIVAKPGALPPKEIGVKPTLVASEPWPTILPSRTAVSRLTVTAEPTATVLSTKATEAAKAVPLSPISTPAAQIAVKPTSELREPSKEHAILGAVPQTANGTKTSVEVPKLSAFEQGVNAFAQSKPMIEKDGQTAWSQIKSVIPSAVLAQDSPNGWIYSEGNRVTTQKDVLTQDAVMLLEGQVPSKNLSLVHQGDVIDISRLSPAQLQRWKERAGAHNLVEYMEVVRQQTAQDRSASVQSLFKHEV